MKTIHFKKVVFIVLLFLNTFIYAQYNGGDADGFAKSEINSTTCSYPLQFYAFNGGLGSLSTVNSITNTTCAIPTQFFPYNGGSGSLSTVNSITNTTCAIPTQFFAYNGGSGDGFASQTINTTFCANPSQFYAYFGGNADGFSVGNTVPVCPTQSTVADFTASATTICVGESVTFTDTSTNLPAAWTWTFTGGTPNSSTVQNPVITYNMPGTYSVTLLAANFNGNDTETKTNFITVNAIPTIVTTTPASRCDSGTVTLQATASANANINWYDAATGGTVLATGTSFTTPSLISTTTYYAEAQFGSCTSARTVVNATVNTTPTITGTTPANRCGNGSVALQATASSGTIQWFATSSGGSGIATGANFNTPILSATTSYFVQASQNGCISPRTEVIASIVQTVAPSGNQNQNFCLGETLTNILVTGQNLNWYTTAIGGSAIPDNTIIVAGETYYVSQTIDSCESAARLGITLTNGGCLASNTFEKYNFKIYPNPIVDVLKIKSDINIDKIEIYSILGQNIYIDNKSSLSYEIDFSRYSVGTYFVQVTTNQFTETFRVIKR